jgi:hypothetical protein
MKPAFFTEIGAAIFPLSTSSFCVKIMIWIFLKLSKVRSSYDLHTAKRNGAAFLHAFRLPLNRRVYAAAVFLPRGSGGTLKRCRRSGFTERRAEFLF